MALPPELQALQQDPFAMYELMRRTQPVLYLEPFRIWLLFRYDDVRLALGDAARFSSRLGQLADGGGTDVIRSRMGESLITSDPPRHTALRSLVNRAFTPRAVAALEPRIRLLAGELLDRVAEAGRCDLIKDLAEPLPVIVIAELLGIPAADRERFKAWSDAVVASADVLVGGSGAPAQMQEEMDEYFRDVIARRRQDPQDDLISALLAAEEEGQHLSEADILSLCWLLLVAGNETTTNLIGNAVRTLLEHPAELERLRNRPDLLPAAIEEVLRFRSPIQAMFRIAVQDVALSGQTIPAGSRIMALIGSANRDEARFPEPDRFDIAREPNPHIAFGHGVHFCLGAPLARLEGRVALEELLRRFDHLARWDDAPLEPARGMIIHGVASLPLRFTRAVLS